MKKKSSSTDIGKPTNIKVFSKAFLAFQHETDFEAESEFKVECNVEGTLNTFTDLNAANTFAAEHKKSHPGHRLMVTATQRD